MGTKAAIGSVSPDMRGDGRQGSDMGGRIEAVRITRQLSPPSTRQLLFAGKSLSKHSTVRTVHVEFVDDREKLPQPSLDPENRQVHLFFAESEFKRVHALLTSRTDRLCYYWHSMDGASRLAWLVTTG